MRIGISLFQYYEAQVGGAGEYIARLIPSLLKVMDRDDRLFLCGSEANLAPFLKLDDARLESVKFHLSHKTIRILRLADLVIPGRLTGFLAQPINALQLDVMLFPQQSLFPQGVQAPKVVTVVDLLHEHFSQQFGFLERKLRIAKDRQLTCGSQHLISISEATQNDLLRTYKLDAARCSVVRLGGNAQSVALPRTFAKPESTQIARPYVFYPANNYPHKNHDMLLRAFERFRNKFPDTPARLIMTGRADDRLRRRILNSSAGPAVEHQGYVTAEQLAELYTDCRAVFFPSKFEGFGIPVVEAMSYGKPIFCSALPVFEELAGNAVHYFDPNSEESLVNGLELAFRTSSLDVDLAAYARILRWLNWERCACETYDVLQSVASGHGTDVRRKRTSQAA